MSSNHNQNPFFSMNQLAESDSRQRSGKAPRVETSGLLDLRRMAKVYEKQNTRGQDEDAIPVPVTVGIGTPPALSLPLALPLPPPPDPEQQLKQAASRNRLLYMMTALAGVLGLGALALAYVVVTGGLGGKSQAASQQPAIAQGAQPEASAAQPMAAAGAKTGESNSDQGSDDTGDKAGGASAASGKPAAAESESTKSVDDDRDDDGARSRRSRERRRSERSDRRERRTRDRQRDSKSTTAEPEKKAPAAAPEDKCMDEIACELAPNPPACCSRYKGRNSGSAGLLSHGERQDSVDEDLPKRLERSDISQGMRAVLGSVNTCRAGHLAKGTVTVSIKVGGDGKVKSARATSSPSTGLGSCVATKVRKATFPRTQKGATFSYPFVFK